MERLWNSVRASSSARPPAAEAHSLRRRLPTSQDAKHELEDVAQSPCAASVSNADGSDPTSLVAEFLRFRADFRGNQAVGRALDAAKKSSAASGDVRAQKGENAASTPAKSSPPQLSGSEALKQKSAQRQLVVLHQTLVDWRDARDRASVRWQEAEGRLIAIAGSGVASLKGMWQLLGPQSVVVGFCSVACVVGAFVTTPLGLTMAASAALIYLLLAQAWLLVPAHPHGTSDKAGATLAVRKAQLDSECYDALVTKAEALLEEARRPPGPQRPDGANAPLDKLALWQRQWSTQLEQVCQECRREVADAEGAPAQSWAQARRMATTYLVGALRPHRSLLISAFAGPVLVRTWLQETMAARGRALTQARRALGASGDPADGFDAAERLILAEAMRQTLANASMVDFSA